MRDRAQQHGVASSGLAYAGPGTQVACAPVWKPIEDLTIVKGDAFAVRLEAGNNTGLDIVYSAAGLPGGIELEGTLVHGVVQPGVAAGDFAVTFTAEDTAGATSQEVVFTVEDPPNALSHLFFGTWTAPDAAGVETLEVERSIDAGAIELAGLDFGGLGAPAASFDLALAWSVRLGEDLDFGGLGAPAAGFALTLAQQAAA